MMRETPGLKVLIVCDSASLAFGGEAALPVHYFRVLRQRGIEAWLLTHARTQEELLDLFPAEHERLIFTPDTLTHRALYRLGRVLPARVALFSTGFLMRLTTQITQRTVIKKLVAERGVNVIHQPTPVSPKESSLIFGFGVPVVIGPMNGGMDYPDDFRSMESVAERVFLRLGRYFADVMNSFFPGKRYADLLLVANERTRESLPSDASRNIHPLVENGVDLALWKQAITGARAGSGHCHFVFVGRLVGWKAVDMLIRAFHGMAATQRATLTIIGDGPERAQLESLASSYGQLTGREGVVGGIFFTGWLPQAECATRLATYDVMVLPSLMECGGAVVLEAMSLALPVIACNWGGPADYLDSSTGILVTPGAPSQYIHRLSAAMDELADNPATRKRLGEAGRAKVLKHFDWERKGDSIIEIYEGLVQQ